MHTTPQPVERYAIAAQEDRCAPRSPFDIPAMIRPSGARAYQTTVRDLSLGGFCSTSSRLHPGTVCFLSLPGLESLQAEVVWWDDGLLGCAFRNLLSPIVYDNIVARWRAFP